MHSKKHWAPGRFCALREPTGTAGMSMPQYLRREPVPIAGYAQVGVTVGGTDDFWIIRLTGKRWLSSFVSATGDAQFSTAVAGRFPTRQSSHTLGHVEQHGPLTSPATWVTPQEERRPSA